MKSFTKVQALTYFLDNFEMSSKLKCKKHRSRKEVIFLTAQGLEYLQSLNLKQHNLEMEAQARRELREQKRRDSEVKRHDKKTERIDFNKVKVESRKVAEDKRHNVKTEHETKRHNKRTERQDVRELAATKWWNTQQVKLGKAKLNELITHDRATESIDSVKAKAALRTANTGARKWKSDAQLKQNDQQIALEGQNVQRRGQDIQYAGTVYSAETGAKSAKYSADTNAGASKYKTDTEFKSAMSKVSVDQAKNEIQRAFNEGKISQEYYKTAMKSIDNIVSSVGNVLGKALPIALAG